MKNISIGCKVIAILSFIILTSCEGFGPASLTIEGQRNVTLRSTKGTQLVLQSGVKLENVKISGTSKEVSLSQDGFDLKFKGAIYDKTSGAVECLPENSKVTTSDEESVGMQLRRRLENSHKEVRQEMRRCQILETKCYGGCNSGHGHCSPSCYTQQRPGWQQVRLDIFHNLYDFRGLIYSGKGTSLAEISGKDTEVSIQETFLSDCM